MSIVDDQYALSQDIQDPLRSYRDRYSFPRDKRGNAAIYLCGNSLGLLPLKARDYIQKEIDRWADFGVKGHFEGDIPWVSLQDSLVAHTTKLVGALPGEVTIMNTLSVNIHMMLVSFYRPSGKRNKILIEWNPFPSDIYALKSHIRYRGLDPKEVLVELKPREGEYVLREEDIHEVIKKHEDDLALVYFGSVNYLNGQVYSFPGLVDAAHSVGALIGFDLAHGAGNIILNLHQWNVDFAVWCHYKYLNGGPNCLAGCFIHEKHFNNTEIQRLEGWWGHDKERRFLMEPDFIPMQGAEAWQVSGPPTFSLAGMKAALEDFEAIGMKALRDKSIKLTSYLYSMMESIGDSRIQIITPKEADQRGCQLSIRIHSGDKRIFYALLEQGIVVDWREPGLIRVAPVPMYNSFNDVYLFATCLAAILKSI
ncbi:MAG: kynureninase [Saprospiraceae bacterium]